MSSEFTQCKIRIERLNAASTKEMPESIADEESPQSPKPIFSLDDIEIYITLKS